MIKEKHTEDDTEKDGDAEWTVYAKNTLRSYPIEYDSRGLPRCWMGELVDS
jgi:hypothetical protein